MQEINSYTDTWGPGETKTIWFGMPPAGGGMQVIATAMPPIFGAPTSFAVITTRFAGTQWQSGLWYRYLWEVRNGDTKPVQIRVVAYG